MRPEGVVRFRCHAKVRGPCSSLTVLIHPAALSTSLGCSPGACAAGLSAIARAGAAFERG
eukprot:7659029-Pyramimonas_sp.AAC.1